MKRWIKDTRFRTTTALATAGLLLCAGLITTASGAGAADTSTKYLGIFRETSPTEVAQGTVSRYGVTPASVQWFDSWATGRAFNASAARSLWDQGIVPHFTWEPWNTALGVADANQIRLQDIISGSWDGYIRARGAEFASAGVPIMVRWGHEFNGNWYPWGIANNNSDPALYIRAYQRVHDLVVATGATNVQWVWCFNNGSTPDASYNDPARSYPGDAYVDWVAIDGYNWGLGPSWDPAGNYWTSFESMFTSSYNKARAIAPKRPIMISEVASSEDGGNKSQWISDTAAVLRSGRFPDLKHVIYFDQDKEERWSGTSSSAVQTAFTSWVNQPYMKGTGAGLAQVAAEYKGTATSQPPTAPPTTAPPTSQPPTAPPTTTPPTSPPPTSACSAAYKTTGSWGGGFQGEVTVRASSAAIKGWTVRWTLASGQTIGQLWNGALDVTGSSVTVTNVAWNGPLDTSGSTSFGFIASGSPSTPTITCTAT